MSATPEARCVWLDEDWFDTLAEALIRTGRPGLAEALQAKWKAAPADPAEAILGVFGPPNYSGWELQMTEAVLVALGYPDGSPRQETPT